MSLGGRRLANGKQYFYVVRFDLAPNEQNLFTGLMVGQFYRWMIWLVISVIFILHFIKRVEHSNRNVIAFTPRVFVCIAVLIVTNIIAIALIELMFGLIEFSFNGLSERVVFFFPITLLVLLFGYIFKK